MEQHEKNMAMVMLVLITTPKLADRAVNLFDEGGLPIQYRFCAEGTASSDMLDMLGLDRSEKNVIVTMLPKFFADKMLKKLRKALKIGTLNSGIAFTVPVTGANNIMVKMVNKLKDGEGTNERKDEVKMIEHKHTVVVAIVNRGFVSQVMDAARSQGATGGTVINCRHIGNEELESFWGISVQDEKEIVMIITTTENKIKIMREISEKCGIRSEASGIVFSLPVDSVIGLPADDDEE